MNSIKYIPMDASGRTLFEIPSSVGETVINLFSHQIFLHTAADIVVRTRRSNQNPLNSRFICIQNPQNTSSVKLIEFHDYISEMPQAFYFKVNIYVLKKDQSGTFSLENMPQKTQEAVQTESHLKNIPHIELIEPPLNTHTNQTPSDASRNLSQSSPAEANTKKHEALPTQAKPSSPLIPDSPDATSSKPSTELVSLPHNCVFNQTTRIITHKKLRFKLSSEFLIALEGNRSTNHHISLDLISVFLKKHSKKFQKEPQGDREYSEYLCVTSNGNKKILNGVISFFMSMQSPEELPIFIIKTAYFADDWQLKNRFEWQRDPVRFNLWKTQICQFNADQIPKK